MAAKVDKPPPLSKHWATAGGAAGDGNTAEIIRQIHALYTDRDVGLCALAQSVGLTIHPPRRKVNVLIIGNHSAGKSSFINWYVGDSVQRTGVAIETQGFTIVTSGSKKTLAPIKGDSTIMLYPYLQPLQEKFGRPLLENLQTRVSVSTEHEFPMVDFIDSPGLVDGDIAYPFDVNEAIVSFAAAADLVFVFLDPMGQALCSRTMRVVKLLNATHFDKLKYYLTKADTVSNSKELMKLMVQITQNIKEHINNQHGLEIPTFWLPTAGGGDRRSGGIDDGLDNDVNQLEEVCETITMAIHQKVQDNLSHVQHDCQQITDKARELLAKDDFERAARRSRELVALVIAACAWTIPLLAFIALIAECKAYMPEVVLDAQYVIAAVDSLYDGLQPLLFSSQGKPDALQLLKLVGGSIVAFVVLSALSKFTRARANKFSLQKLDVVLKWRSHEHTVQKILQQRQALFLEYVRTYTPAEDV